MEYSSIRIRCTDLRRHPIQNAGDNHQSYLPNRSDGLFIDNQWVMADGDTLDIINPVNEEILTSIPNTTAADVDCAVQAAQRANALLKIADLLEADADRFAVLETLDVGKPIRERRAVDIRSRVKQRSSPWPMTPNSVWRVQFGLKTPTVRCG